MNFSLLLYLLPGTTSLMGTGCSPHIPTRDSFNRLNSSSASTLDLRALGTKNHYRHINATGRYHHDAGKIDKTCTTVFLATERARRASRPNPLTASLISRTGQLINFC